MQNEQLREDAGTRKKKKKKKDYSYTGSFDCTNVQEINIIFFIGGFLSVISYR